jgi:hypothetical protein
MNDLSLAHADALRLLINELRDPTPQEIAVYQIAMKEAEQRDEIVTVIPGKLPGYYFRLNRFDIPWRLCDSVSEAFDQTKISAKLVDVYLYIDGIQARLRAMSVDEVRHKLKKQDVLLDDDVDLLEGVSRAFYYGATYVELRPMFELEVK